MLFPGGATRRGRRHDPQPGVGGRHGPGPVRGRLDRRLPLPACRARNGRAAVPGGVAGPGAVRLRVRVLRPRLRRRILHAHQPDFAGCRLGPLFARDRAGGGPAGRGDVPGGAPGRAPAAVGARTRIPARSRFSRPAGLRRRRGARSSLRQGLPALRGPDRRGIAAERGRRGAQCRAARADTRRTRVAAAQGAARSRGARRAVEPHIRLSRVIQRDADRGLAPSGADAAYCRVQGAVHRAVAGVLVGVLDHRGHRQLPVRHLVRHGTRQQRPGYGRRAVVGTAVPGRHPAAAGYHQVYAGGAGLDFAGKGAFLSDHGFDELLGWEHWDAEGHDAIGARGLPDDVLFEEGLEIVSRLHGRERPFNLTLLTIGTHLPGFFFEGCPEYSTEEDDHYLNAVHCTDYLFGRFVDELEDRGILEDTVLFVQADHGVFENPEMQRLFGDAVSDTRLLTRVAGPAAVRERLARTATGAPDSSVNTVATVVDLLGCATTPASCWPDRGSIPIGRHATS
ncbi:MAG: sulfatase-like hydrolase/transferase [Gammaproteobacteria bacterium]|nr:sulfatase-like hydrolase/transferase [Gammaproteobacteria bacterium]